MRADVLGRNIVPIFPPERQAAGRYLSFEDTLVLFGSGKKMYNFLQYNDILKVANCLEKCNKTQND
jgi:hypothetical protein